MKFLGTGAGEGTPNPFCTCHVCSAARRDGGREIRTRSSFLLDERTIIDLGADYFAQTIMHRLNLEGLTDVLFTHTHDDHFNYTLIWERIVRLAGGEQPLNLYFTDEAVDFMEKFYYHTPVVTSPERNMKGINIVKLNFGETVKIGPYTVTPFRGHHGTPFEKNSANYLIEKDGKKLYYAVDSGFYSEETFAALAGQKIDTFIMECTVPNIEKTVMTENSWHMDFFLCLKTLDLLYRSGAITEKTEVYFTHISPNGATYAELCERVASLDLPYHITVAYDGLEI